MITIVLAEDHNVVREGFRSLLENESDLHVVGEASDGLAAVDVTVAHKPDVLIVDVKMPGLNGLDVIRQVTTRSPRTRVVVLSMHANEAYVLEALRNGASGYVLKGADADELVEAVHTVVDGRRYLSPPISDRVIDAYVRRAEATQLDRYEKLTNREREVLQLVAEGHTNAEVAERLSISTRTVETHRANVMEKLELETQADLIRFAIKRGLIPLDQ